MDHSDLERLQGRAEQLVPIATSANSPWQHRKKTGRSRDRDVTTSASDKLAYPDEIYCEVAARKRHATQFNAAELLGPIVML
jgi:hypothetical protein